MSAPEVIVEEKRIVVAQLDFSQRQKLDLKQEYLIADLKNGAEIYASVDDLRKLAGDIGRWLQKERQSQ